VFDAVIDRVSQQVHDGVADLSSIERSSSMSFAFDRRTRLACRRSRRVAHHARKSIEHLRHRHHAARRDLVAQLADEP
jgi:hypothetical protein